MVTVKVSLAGKFAVWMVTLLSLTTVRMEKDGIEAEGGEADAGMVKAMIMNMVTKIDIKRFMVFSPYLVPPASNDYSIVAPCSILELLGLI